MDSQYPPGSLFSEGQLADEFKISRTPIREALRLSARPAAWSAFCRSAVSW